MARKKPTRRKTQSAKTPRTKLATGVSRDIVAIILVAFAVLLTVAFFGGGGSLSQDLLRILELTVGKAAYGLPLALLLLAWRMFLPDRDPTPIASNIGLVLMLLALAGLLHIGVESANSLSAAEAGNAGGYSGFILRKILLALLNVFTSSVVLVAAMLIGLIMVLNVRLGQVLSLFKFKRRHRGPDEGLFKLPETPKSDSKMTINAKVPLESGRGEEAAEAPEAEVLTTGVDPDWRLPPLDLLEEKVGKADAGNPNENAGIIKSTLSSFGIEVAMEEVNIGPTVTQYTLRPAQGIRLSKISELANNLELALAAHPIRIEAPIPGKSAVGIEVPNRKAAIVRLKEVLMSAEWKERKSALGFALGRDIAGKAIVGDIAAMPHLLVAGATGSGKSIMINAILMSLLYRNSPANLRLILVDPKRVELRLYDNIPHLLAPVITEPERCLSALKWAIAEMERRYSVFADLGKRNISEYNTVNKETAMPYILIVIDELADLMSMAAQEVEGAIVRLAQKARATGIHLVLATQRPSVNVITGLIKANVPARIAFSTVSQVDSRTIIDQSGAEKLLGRGDMLFVAPEFIKSRRIQGTFVGEKELVAVTDYLRGERPPSFNEEVLAQDVKLSGKAHLGDVNTIDDSLFLDAAQLVIESRKASASLLQRRLRIGYARAARLLDILEERGIVSAPDGARPRDVLANSINEVMGEDIDPIA